MDVQLTRRGDYAVRAAIALALAAPSGEYRKLREIASEMSIPLRYTHEIVSLLVRAGLAGAVPGKLGGYRLIGEPEAITLLQVVEAAEGPLRIDRCTLSGGPCHWQQQTCAVHPMFEDAARALARSLAGQTLADVIRIDGKLRTHERGLGESPRWSSARMPHDPQAEGPQHS